MIIECDRIETHEGVAIGKHLKKGITKEDATILWYPLLGFVTVQKDDDLKVIHATNLHYIKPVSTQLLEQLKSHYSSQDQKSFNQPLALNQAANVSNSPEPIVTKRRKK